MKGYRAWESPELVSVWLLITFGGLQMTPCSIISSQNSLQCVMIIIMVITDRTQVKAAEERGPWKEAQGSSTLNHLLSVIS